MSDSQLKQLTILGENLLDLDSEIERTEARLNNMKNQRKQLAEVKIPDIMLNVGMAEFRLTSGYKLRVAPTMDVRIPKENMDAVDDWLETNHHAGMVKRTVEIYVPKNVDKTLLLKLSNYLAELNLTYSQKKSVHWQTLNAFARELEKSGESLPEDLFSIYRSYSTKVTE